MQFMLNKKIALLGAAAIAMVSTGANAATASADARVVILAPVELEQTAVLDFGVVAPGAAGGTVTLPANSDTRACGTGITCVGAAQRGGLRVRGSNGYNVAIIVAPSTTLTGGGAPMGLSLTTDAPAVLAANGNWQAFNVGGTLTIGANQTAGTYTGTYAVTADYQ
jgi:Mat/Ecp fimbriae major subunit